MIKKDVLETTPLEIIETGIKLFDDKIKAKRDRKTELLGWIANVDQEIQDLEVKKSHYTQAAEAIRNSYDDED